MPPSSPEEIARQHQEATMLVEASMPCAPRRELGEISLDDKVQPTWSPPPPTPPSPSDEEKKEPNDDANQSPPEDPLLKQQQEQEQQPPSSLDTLKNPHCWSTRGHVEVTKLQTMVREGFNLSYKDKENLPPLSPTNYWDPRNADKHNVSLTRPSHDGWGIGKIVLMFSDDFLTKTYQLPWWKEFEQALQPALDVLKQSYSCSRSSSSSSHEEDDNKCNSNADTTHRRVFVVRALLASLPPGVTIPVHNDSGEWVKTTHRVHVPILVNDPSKILFRVGPAPHLLQRIDCTPGHVFEINNQAKHAVSNCEVEGSNHHRVHLILDYVVDTTPIGTRTPYDPIVLEPGEKLVQTRRSIDRLRDMAQRPTPSYVILGAQKAGTTSLYDYINQHPWVVKARRRETHCLDWRWNEQLKTDKGRLAYCQKFFFTEQLKKRPSCLTGDSTPSYLLDSKRVIPRLKSVFPWDMKFFVMMRDPVRRAGSHYAMVTSMEGTPAQLEVRGKEWREKSLWEVVQQELSKMDECGLIPYWNIQDGIVDQDIFNRFAGSSQEDEAWNKYLNRHVPLNTGSYGLLTRGMYAVQLRPWFRAFSRDQFLCLRLESMKYDGVPAIMQLVWDHLDLPNHPVHDESAKNTREYQSMDPQVESYLQRFFQPHNRTLASVLEDDSKEWRDPWPYAEVSRRV